ncbi:hypothetical protein QCA50_011110 [Cerrena zonata]|uniref:F-box domain-containing protein n=1 Tax=Cerrena zonata TaxID=2478898 RepID=A0AAW0G629_9APHY
MDSILASYHALSEPPHWPHDPFDELLPHSYLISEGTPWALQWRVKRYHRDIAQLNGRLNELEPFINRLLPRELLAEVFKQYMLLCTPPGYHKAPNKGSEYAPYAWLQVAHVCRHWRYIALSYPLLFKYLHLRGRLHSVELISEWLTHSEEAPIYFLGQLDKDDACWDIVIPHLSHTVNLDIVLPQILDPEVDVAWPICPLMKSVSCELPDEGKDNPAADGLENFLKCLPYLEELVIDLNLNPVKWTTLPLPPSIKHLKIIAWSPRQANDIKEFISLIQTLPCLTELEMKNTMNPASDASIDTPDTIIIVPPLHNLRLSGSIGAMCLMLESIACVHGFHLNLYNITELPRLLNIFTSNEQIRVHFESLLGAKLRVYKDSGDYLIRFEGWSTSILDGVNYEVNDAVGILPTLTISIEQGSHQDTMETVDTLCGGIYPSLRSLESLSIALDDDRFDGDDPMIIISVCRQLKGLRRLHLSAHHALSYTFLKIFASRHEDFIFPQLVFLRIICFHGSGFKVNHILRIRDALVIRARRAAKPLDVLVLESSEPLEDWVDTEIREELDLVKNVVGELRLLELESDSGSDSD